MSPCLAIHSLKGVPTAVLKVSQFNANGEIATITCTFLDGSSHFCMVCCSTDPYVPFGLSGFGYFSSNNGPSVRVSLQGLSSNQTYYCKAAATNSNSNSCAGQVVGGVKILFSFVSATSSSSASQSVPTSPGKFIHVMIFMMICH